MKGVDDMHMYPQLSMISLGKVLLNNLFSTSMNNRQLTDPTLRLLI